MRFVKRVLVGSLLIAALAAGCGKGDGAGNAQATAKAASAQAPTVAAQVAVGAAPATSTPQKPVVVPPAPASAEPRMVLDPEKHDAGKVKEGEKVEFTYHLRNDGNGPLLITSVHPRCVSCMEAKLDKKEIGPGETGQLAVTYQPVGYGGEFVRYVVIESNNPRDRSATVVLQGDVTPEFTLVPAAADFGEVAPGESKKLEFTLVRNFGGPLTLSVPTELPSGVHVELPAAITAPIGQKLTFGVDLTLDKAARSLDTKLKLPVNGQAHKVLEVSVKAKVTPPVELSQTDLFFGSVPVGQTATKVLPLRIAQGVVIEGLETKTEAKYLKVDLLQKGPAIPPQIEVTLLPAGAQGPFSANEELHFRLASGGTVQASLTCFGIRSQ